MQVEFEDVPDEMERLTTDSPETIFEREWSRAVFSAALRRLRQECEAAGKVRHYELLERYDLADERPTYAELAKSFAISLTDVTNRLSRIRRQLRGAVLDVLRELTASEEEFREEARALLRERAP